MITDKLHQLMTELEELKQSRVSIDTRIIELQSEIDYLNNQVMLSPLLDSWNQALPDIIATSTNEISLVKKSSPVKEKYQLFTSLFAGRTDVHARRFQKRSGSAGYSPVCLNQFNDDFCPMNPKVLGRANCLSCEHQSFSPISLDAFIAHLNGDDEKCRDVLGAYPTDKDDNCTFIVADFDGKPGTDLNKKTSSDLKSKPGVNSDGKLINDVNHQNSELTKTSGFQRAIKAASAFRQTCLMNLVPAYLEISRSGMGFHVWLFFSEPVPARLARKLFSGLWTTTMEQNPCLDFTVYDRFIPSQDMLTSNGLNSGLGNLVALPLQGRCRDQRRTCFIDSQFQTYPDQWEFLSRIMKFSITDLEQAIYHLPKGSELGTLVIVEEENDARKPWEAKKPESKLQKSDFSSSIEIISANMLHIPKTVLSPRALSRISRLAAFDNPEFYRKQRLRVSTRDTPRVISTHQESDEYISIPRGTKPALTALLEASKASFSLIDMTNHGVPLEVSFTGKLHDEQLLAADALLEHDIGVLSAAPGFGKTVVAASIIANRKVNTLVLLRNQQVLRQWKQTLASYLSFFNKLPFGQANSKRTKGTRSIGEYSSYKKELTGIVDIAMVQSLIKHGEVDDIVKNYGMVIVDEVHQVPAVTFAAVLQHVNAKYVYGLTATPSRKDGRTPIIGFEFGPIRYRTDDREQAKKRPFEHYMIPKFTSFQRTSAHDEQNYSTLLSDLVSNSDRNQMIVDDVISAINMGRNPLVLSDRIDHVIALSDLLRDSCENVITLIGKLSIAERREAIERLSELKADDRFVIVATAKLVGEGFDYPRLDTLFLTVPISWKGRIAQYVGRLHRIYEGKQDVYVYDYVDASIPVLENMYYKRLRSYKSIGYSALVDNGAGSTNSSSVLFGKDEYWAFFKNDCEQSKKEIVISSPKLVLHQVARVLTSLSPALLNDLVITILTLPIDELSASARSAAKQCMDRMRELNIKVFETPGLFQKMAVFDQQIVWYGSMSLLGNAMSTDNLLRLDDPIIAKTLLKMINTQ